MQWSRNGHIYERYTRLKKAKFPLTASLLLCIIIAEILKTLALNVIWGFAGSSNIDVIILQSGIIFYSFPHSTVTSPSTAA